VKNIPGMPESLPAMTYRKKISIREEKKMLKKERGKKPTKNVPSYASSQKIGLFVRLCYSDEER